MEFKREAEAEEGKILKTFDYALNISSNGERRPLDLIKKLGDREYMRKRKSGILSFLFFQTNFVSESKKRKSYVKMIIKA